MKSAVQVRMLLAPCTVHSTLRVDAVHVASVLDSQAVPSVGAAASLALKTLMTYEQLDRQCITNCTRT